MGIKNTSANSEILQMEKNVSNSEKFSCKLRKENNRLSQRLIFYKNAFRTNISQFREKSIELQDLKSELQKIRITSEDAEKEREELKELHTKVYLLNNDLKEKNEKLNKIEANFEQNMNQIAVEKDRLLSNMALSLSENDVLKKEINGKKVKIEHLEFNLHNSRKDIIEYKQKINKNAEEMENLNYRLENLKSDNKRLSKEYESLISHIKTTARVMKDNRGFLKM